MWWDCIERMHKKVCDVLGHLVMWWDSIYKKRAFVSGMEKVYDVFCRFR